MTGAKLGDKIKVHFTLKDEKGKVFDQTPEAEPEEIILGEGDILPGIEVSLVGMNSGDTKTINLTPNMHYGDRDNELVFDLERTEFPEDVKLEVGENLEYGLEDGTSAFFVIKEVKGDKIKLDANHPLAGKKITVDIKIQEVNS